MDAKSRIAKKHVSLIDVVVKDVRLVPPKVVVRRVS